MTLSFLNETKKSASEGLLKLVLATASVAVITNPLVTSSAVAIDEISHMRFTLKKAREIIDWKKEQVSGEIRFKELVPSVYVVHGRNDRGGEIEMLIEAENENGAKEIVQKALDQYNFSQTESNFFSNLHMEHQGYFSHQLDLAADPAYDIVDKVYSRTKEQKDLIVAEAKKLGLVWDTDADTAKIEDVEFAFTDLLYSNSHFDPKRLSIPGPELLKDNFQKLEKFIILAKKTKLPYTFRIPIRYLGNKNMVGDMIKSLSYFDKDVAKWLTAEKYPNVFELLGNLSKHINKISAKKARQVGRKYSSADGANFAMDAVESELDTRELSRIAAVAAGDDQVWSKGIWVRGSFGSSVQKPTTGHVGNRGNVVGGTIGFEMENDCGSLYGISYTHAYGKYVFKDDGDRAKINFNVFSLYGEHEVNENIVLRGMLSYSANRIKTEDNREAPGDTITASFRGNTYAVDLMAGYKMDAGEFNLMPFIQTRYNHNTQNAYEDSEGTKFSKKSSDAWTGKLGIRASKAIAHDSGAIFTPYLSGSAQYDLSVDSQEVVAFDTDNTPIQLKVNKQDGKFERPRFGYNLGGGLIVEHGKIEVSAGYKGHFRKNYHSHQGSLKLKVAL